MIPAGVVWLALGLLPSAARGGDTFAKIHATGVVRCGVNEALRGFAQQDAQGHWTGLNVDFCRAVAAATLGDAEKVDFVPLRASARFLALQSGEIDLLVRNTTWTLEREAGLGVHFVGTLFYDGQTVMVQHESKVSHIAELNGVTMCLEKGTNHNENLTDYFRTHGLTYQPLILDSLAEVKDAFFAGRCQGYTSDLSQLAAIRAEVPGGAERFVILPELIAKEPLSPVVQRGDEAWFTLVKWVLFALIEADVRGDVGRQRHPHWCVRQCGECRHLCRAWQAIELRAIPALRRAVDPLPVGGSGPVCAGPVLRHRPLAASWDRHAPAWLFWIV